MSLSDEYARQVYAARRAFQQGLQVDLVRALYLEYAMMLETIAEELAAQQITAARADLLTESVMRELQILRRRLDSTVEAAKRAGADLAVRGHVQALSRVSSLSGVAIGHSFVGVPARALELMHARRGVGGQAYNFRTLINRHLQEMAPEVNRFLSSAVARGVSSRQAATELAALLARDDPAVLEALNQLNISRLSRRITEIGDIPDAATYAKAKGLLSDSYRIAVHETNVAYTEAHVIGQVESPVVGNVKWEVSSRHWGLPSSPDVCSYYHLHDSQGLGAGVFDPRTVPTLPHPFCGCHTMPILRHPSEWRQGKGGPRFSPEIQKSQVRNILQRASSRVTATRPRPLTEKHIERQTAVASKYLALANASVGELVGT